MDKKRVNHLMREIADGNTQAFEELYLEMRGILIVYIHNVISGKLSNSYIEDILQDTFKKAIDAAKSKLLYVNCFSWLITIAKNTALDYMRKHKREVLTDDFTPYAGCGDHTAQTDDEIAVREALNTLTKEEETIVRLKYMKDLTFKDVASILKLKESTVKEKFYHAMKKLRNYFDSTD